MRSDGAALFRTIFAWAIGQTRDTVTARSTQRPHYFAQRGADDFNPARVVPRCLWVGDDFGRVRIYKYPVIQGEAESVELLGHADHVMHVQPMVDGQIVSSGGREVSLLQWQKQ